jgi:hypothetical protein
MFALTKTLANTPFNTKTSAIYLHETANDTEATGGLDC